MKSAGVTVEPAEPASPTAPDERSPAPAADGVSQPPAPAAYPERIHFARRSGIKNRHPDRETLQTNVGVLFILLLTPVAWRFGVSVGVFFLASGFALLVLILFSTALWQRLLLSRRRVQDGGVDDLPDDACRLRCIGTPDELASLGEFPNVPFEPVLFYASFAAPHARKMSTAAFGLALSVAGLALWSDWVYSVATMLGWGICVLALPLVASAFVAFVWPTHFRVVPGRVDVLRQCVFSRRGHPTRRIELREARVLVDLRDMVVLIEDADRRQRIAFSIAMLPHRRRFAYMLFWAAMSRYEPGPLPDDELLG